MSRVGAYFFEQLFVGLRAAIDGPPAIVACQSMSADRADSNEFRAYFQWIIVIPPGVPEYLTGQYPVGRVRRRIEPDKIIMAEIFQFHLECPYYVAVANDDDSLVQVGVFSFQMRQDVGLQPEAKKGKRLSSASGIDQESVQPVLAFGQLEQAPLFVCRAVIH